MKTILLKKTVCDDFFVLHVTKKAYRFLFSIRILFEANLKNISVYLVNKVFI